MRKHLAIVFTLLFAISLNAQIPTMIEVSEDNWESWYQGDFKNVLDFVAQGADTVMLLTGGFNYTTKDTTPMLIRDAVVIMAAPGLEEKPIISHPNSGFADGTSSSSMEIFRVQNDVKFEGIAFMGNLQNDHTGCKYAVRVGDYEDDVTGQVYKVKEDFNMTFIDCHFENFHSDGDQDKQGNAIYFLRPLDPIEDQDHIAANKVQFENCTFKDIGDEAIRVSENQKYPAPGGAVTTGTVAFDTLIVRNVTFDDIDAECIRIYGDNDTSFVGPTYVDGFMLVEHCTVVNSAPRFMYAKTYRNNYVRDILIANGRPAGVNRPDRNDYLIEIQLSGSELSHVDTFNCVIPNPNPSGTVRATKDATLFEDTIYGYDPDFEDAVNGDYTLKSSSPLYHLSSDETAIGDLRWATNEPDPWDPPVGIDARIADRIELTQNHPNPFNPTTEITFALERADFTTLTIYNVLGHKVKTQFNRFMHAGEYTVEIEGADLPSGVYFYELRQSNISEMKKMILMK